MSGWLSFLAVALLVSLAAALWRVWRGPSDADRMMAAQLVGTAGVGLVLIFWAQGAAAARGRRRPVPSTIPAPRGCWPVLAGCCRRWR